MSGMREHQVANIAPWIKKEQHTAMRVRTSVLSRGKKKRDKRSGRGEVDIGATSLDEQAIVEGEGARTTSGGLGVVGDHDQDGIAFAGQFKE